MNARSGPAFGGTTFFLWGVMKTLLTGLILIGTFVEGGLFGLQFLAGPGDGYEAALEYHQQKSLDRSVTRTSAVSTIKQAAVSSD